jgi:hypothetical protein
VGEPIPEPPVRLEFDDVTAFAFLIDVYEKGRMRFNELDAWLRENVTPK